MQDTTLAPMFVTVEKAAAVLDLTKWTVYELCRDGVIASKRQGRVVLVDIESLRQYGDSLPATSTKENR